MKKLYVSDLDGTLLRNDSTLSSFAYNNLQLLLKAGLQFVFATARGILSVKQIFDGIEFPLPVIEFNGTFLSDFKTGEHLVVRKLKKDVYHPLLAHIIGQDFTPVISTYHSQKDRLYYSGLNNEAVRHHIASKKQATDPRLTFTDDLQKVPDQCVVNISVIDTMERTSELLQSLEAFKEELAVYHLENQYMPGWYWLMLHDKLGTKDQAITALMEKYGFEQEQLTVFGDNCNDLGMFKMAKYSIAVANAIPELKAAATHSIGANEDDSVVKYLLEDFGRQK